MIYDNEYYYIRTSEDNQEYQLINKDTGVIEMTSKVLPKVIITADEYNGFLKSREPAQVEIPLDTPDNVVQLR